MTVATRARAGATKKAISARLRQAPARRLRAAGGTPAPAPSGAEPERAGGACTCCVIGRFSQRGDRKSTRLNSSHVAISYAVFCLKKKKRRTETNGQIFTMKYEALLGFTKRISIDIT